MNVHLHVPDTMETDYDPWVVSPTRWLIDSFEKFDKSGDGLLQQGEVMKLLSSLNISMTPSQLKKLLKEFCPNTPEPALNKEKFAAFFKMISTRDEIVQLMNKYTSGGSHLTPSDLLDFVKTEQKVSLACVTQLEGHISAP